MRDRKNLAMRNQRSFSLEFKRQVVCVTHLPQIAAFTDAHFSVHKEASGARTLSMPENPEDESQIKEIAIMLAGPQYTKTSSNNAHERMQKAAIWKGLHRYRI